MNGLSQVMTIKKIVRCADSIAQQPFNSKNVNDSRKMTQLVELMNKLIGLEKEVNLLKIMEY